MNFEYNNNKNYTLKQSSNEIRHYIPNNSVCVCVCVCVCVSVCVCVFS